MGVAMVRDCVRKDCERSAFGAAFYEEHLALVARYGNCLAQRLGADVQAVELAAWLHDLAAVRDPATMPQHATLGAGLARDLLSQYGFGGGLVESVTRAIASHSCPLSLGSGTIEEVCVSQADAVAQIVRPFYWLYFALAVRKCGFEESRQWLLQLSEAKWNGLIEPARELVGNRYFAARQLLDRAE